MTTRHIPAAQPVDDPTAHGKPEQPVMLSWTDLQLIIARIAEGVRHHDLPQVLVAISRGGLVPAAMLSHQLDIRDLRILTVAHTIDDRVNAAKTGAPQITRPHTLGDLNRARVLLVDDIAGSGKTLAAAHTAVAERGPAGIRSAVVAVNQANWPPGRDDWPDHVGTLAHGWLVFPWERQPEVRP